ncbi:MAG: hypothetical protein NTZ26_12080, partial [Candidatus Aminicenantes bacterium]|nr:hypothetical protein [Candidatus Aminicenantes bacterium]
LAVRYPTPARAEPALRAFRAALMPGTNEGRAYRSPAGTWTAAGLAGGLAAFVLRAGSEEEALGVVTKTLERIIK